MHPRSDACLGSSHPTSTLTASSRSAGSFSLRIFLAMASNGQGSPSKTACTSPAKPTQADSTSGLVAQSPRGGLGVQHPLTVCQLPSRADCSPLRQTDWSCSQRATRRRRSSMLTASSSAVRPCPRAMQHGLATAALGVATAVTVHGLPSNGVRSRTKRATPKRVCSS